MDEEDDFVNRIEYIENLYRPTSITNYFKAPFY